MDTRILTILIALTWTAPGDDGEEGMASIYDMRYAPDSISLVASWSTCQVVDGLPAPDSAGVEQSVEMPALPPGDYWVGLKTADEVPNWSGISNVVRWHVASTSGIEEQPEPEPEPMPAKSKRRFGC